jgi:hypothetical protein
VARADELWPVFRDMMVKGSADSSSPPRPEPSAPIRMGGGVMVPLAMMLCALLGLLVWAAVWFSPQ